jgi:hypothetical protein
MSQFYVGVSAGSLPPSVPLQFTADDATIAVPSGNNLNLFSNDTTENNSNGLRSTAALSTLTYQLTNRLQGTTSTSGAVTSPIITFTPTVIGTYAIEIRVAAYNTTSSLGAGYSIFGTARFDGVNSNLCGTPDKIINEEGVMSSANCTMTVSVANILINGVGFAGNDINWSAVGLYTFVGV